MSANDAASYAESVGRGFWQASDAGAPFGLADCEECGAAPGDTCEHDDDREPVDAMDWLAGQLDIEYRVSSDGALRSVQVAITLGGPNAYVDTAERALVVYWSGRASWALPGDMLDAIDDAAGEYWDVSR